MILRCFCKVESNNTLVSNLHDNQCHHGKVRFHLRCAQMPCLLRYMKAIDQRKPASEGGVGLQFHEQNFPSQYETSMIVSHLFYKFSQFIYAVERSQSNLPVQTTLQTTLHDGYNSQLECSLSSKAKINCLKVLPKVQTYDPQQCIH